MMKIRPMLVRAIPSVAIGATLFGLTACNPVGEGIGPTRLVVNGPGAVLDAATGRVYECLRAPITATLFFSDGSAADFTNRVRWSSSNTAALRVSNGDEPLPAPTVGNFAPGTVTPVAPGNATVTASFSSFSDTINLTVATPTSLTIQQTNPQTLIPQSLVNNTLRIGPTTVADLSVLAVVDGIPSTVDVAATWAFDVPNTAVATIDPTSGLIAAVAPGTLTARARFAPCTMSAAATVTVAPITAITLRPEFNSGAPDFTPVPLVVGNNERITAMADFGNGPEQDISTQTVFTSSAPTVAGINVIPGLTNVLSALTAGGPVTISATFTSAGTAIAAPPIQVSTVAGTLQSIALTPATATSIAGSSLITEFRAIGTYTGGITQEVTRQVSFTSSNPVAGIVSGALQTAGQVTPGSLTPGTTTITGTATSSGVTPAPTATATYTTVAPTP